MLSPKHRSLIQRIGFIALAVVLVVLAFTPMFSLKTTSASMNYETQYFNLSESLTNVVERSRKKEMEAAQTADEKAAVMSKYTEIDARMIELKEGTGENLERSMVTFIKEMPKAFSLIKYVFADKILTELEKKQDEIETNAENQIQNALSPEEMDLGFDETAEDLTEEQLQAIAERDAKLKAAEEAAAAQQISAETEETAAAKEKLADLDPSDITVESIETTCMIMTTINPVAQISTNGLASVFSFLFIPISIFALVLAFVIIPLLIILRGASAVLTLLFKKEDLSLPNNAGLTKACGLVGIITSVLMAMFLNSDITLTKNGGTILILCIAFPALSLILAHLVRRGKKERRYMVFMQLLSVLGLVGFYFWATNLISTDFANYFTKPELLAEITEGAAEEKPAFALILTQVCGLIIQFGALIAAPYVVNRVLRMCCMYTDGDKKKLKRSKAGKKISASESSGEILPIIISLIPLIPLFVYGLKFTDGMQSAWIMSLVGAGIMLAAKILLPILRNVFAHGVSASDATVICMGGTLNND